MWPSLNSGALLLPARESEKERERDQIETPVISGRWVLTNVTITVLSQLDLMSPVVPTLQNLLTRMRIWLDQSDWWMRQGCVSLSEDIIFVVYLSGRI